MHLLSNVNCTLGMLPEMADLLQKNEQIQRRNEAIATAEQVDELW